MVGGEDRETEKLPFDFLVPVRSSTSYNSILWKCSAFIKQVSFSKINLLSAGLCSLQPIIHEKEYFELGTQKLIVYFQRAFISIISLISSNNPMSEIG